ncbi:hypothetical protein GQX74_003438 [Glossina fuscipes]|nr:hypothetical protein GQX74_003438 [Glossina fuscipes]
MRKEKQNSSHHWHYYYYYHHHHHHHHHIIIIIGVSLISIAIYTSLVVVCQFSNPMNSQLVNADLAKIHTPEATIHPIKTETAIIFGSLLEIRSFEAPSPFLNF